mmetsp:Transcript_60612/g.154023  ORF Transcript_60612/g.154023 Transcript_60612/m.154023 type:complete len:331 (-) Transcript_60612:953-1945(-)
MATLACPASACATTWVGSERLNLSKFRSTPCGGAVRLAALSCADSANVPSGPARRPGEAAESERPPSGPPTPLRRANCRAGLRTKPWALVAINDEDGRTPSAVRAAKTEVAPRLPANGGPPAERLPPPMAAAAKRKRSMPKSTPPYKPNVNCERPFLPFTDEVSSPSFTESWEKHRSFHSCGTSIQHVGDSSSARLNHCSPKRMPDSSKYFAMIEAFATSRSWQITPLRSAMRSKFLVKDSAYLTSGCPGRVTGASSRPRGPRSCSRASTPSVRAGAKTPSSEICISAFRTTNHSRPDHFSGTVSSPTSMQLFMPSTGCWYAPMDNSFKW